MCFAHLAVAGWIEAFFTYVVYTFVKKVAPDEIYKNDQQGTPKKGSLKYLVYVIISSSVPAGMNHGFNYTALFGDYTIPGTSLPIGYILSAITAILIFFLISKVLMAVYGSTNKAPNK